jgi:WD40 repeat protein
MLQTLEGHTSSVRSVAFSPDGKQIVSGSGDRTVRLWDTATGQQVLPALEGHTNSVRSVAFSPDGKQIVSGSGDWTVRLWDTATGQQVLPVIEGHTDWVRSVAFSPDGKQVVSKSDNQMLPHTLTVSNDWIKEDGANILWLPSNYRTTVIAIYRESVVLARSSGRISFFEFTHASKFL